MDNGMNTGLNASDIILGSALAGRGGYGGGGAWGGGYYGGYDERCCASQTGAKINMCLNGQTLNVSRSACPGLIRAGATCGPCPEPD